MSPKHPPKSEVALAETAAWLDLLYGKCNHEHGQLILVAPTRRHIIGCFNVNEIIEAVDVMHDNPGCYAKVNLMDYDKIIARTATGIGGIDEVKTIVSFHLDVDAGKSAKYVSRRHAWWALESMPVPPTLVVNSDGYDGGFHAYWCLKEPHLIDGDQLAIRKQTDAWNEHLKTLCGGRLDKTSNLDRVLRCVGVPRLDGGNVCCEQYKPEREYELSDLVA